MWWPSPIYFLQGLNSLPIRKTTEDTQILFSPILCRLTTEIYQEINRETCQQDPNTVTEMLDTEKQELPNRIETQINNNRNTIQPNSTERTLTKEDKMNVETIKIIMSKKKTTLPSLRNQDSKTVTAETEKNKQIIDKYLNEQHNWIKRTDLCRNKIILC